MRVREFSCVTAGIKLKKNQKRENERTDLTGEKLPAVSLYSSR